jgi:signal transduction histidine kinase/CheY-like chemotaxis protein
MNKRLFQATGARALFALAAVLVVADPAYPQASKEAGLPLMRHFSGRDFGYTNALQSIAQDQRGIMYFGGSWPYEYDGVTWRSNTVPDSNTARAVAVDSHGTFWIGGRTAGYREGGSTGPAQMVSLRDRTPEEHRAFNTMQRAVTTPQAVFFWAFERLLRWDGKTMHGWKPQSRFEGLSEVNGRIFVSQRDIGLQEVVGDELRTLPAGDAWKASRRVRLDRYDERRMLVSAQGEPLKLYDGEKVIPFPTEADEYLAKNEVFSKTPLRDGGFCVTTRLGGVVIIGHDGQLRLIINRETGLPSQAVNEAFEDRDGALWLAHLTGATRVDINAPITVISRQVFNTVTRHDGVMYFASIQAGRALFRLVPNPTTGVATLQQVQAAPNVGGGPLLSFKDPTKGVAGQLLVGGLDGVLALRGDTLAEAIPGLPPTSQVQGLLQSKAFPNRVYVGRLDGITAMRWENGKWYDEGKLQGYGATTVWLVEDKAGRLWTGSSQGVFRIKNLESGWSAAVVEAITGPNAGSHDIYAVNGMIFASNSTQDIKRWDEASSKFVPDTRFFLPVPRSQYDGTYPVEGGVFHSNRSSVQQRLGLFVRQADNSYRLEEDVLRRITPYIVRSAFLDPDGTLWLAGADGAFRVDRSRAGASQVPYSALIRRVRTNGDTVVFDGASDGSTPPQISYDRNNLGFEFAAPTYGDEKGAQYRYKLEGADADWTPWARVTEANYAGLAPGRYTFRVAAKNIDGKESEEGSFAFTVLPPWYRTGVAYGAYAVALFLLGAGARRRLIERERETARRQREVLEGMVTERTQQISERAAELATVNRISQALSTQLDKDKVIQLVGEEIRQVFHASVAYISLLDRATMMLHFPYLYGENVGPVPFGDGLTSQIIKSGTPLLINEDVEGESEKMGVQSIGQKVASYLGVPIPSGGHMIGVISVQSTEKEGRFTEADQRLLATIAAAVGVAFHNASLFEQARVARAAAEEADAAKSNFLSTVSHELRTPLTSVMGFAKIVRRRLEERIFPIVPEDDKKIAQVKKQISDNLDVVVSEGERLTKLINDVLDLAKIEAGKLTWNMETTAIGDVVDQALSATASLSDAKKLEVTRDIQAALPAVVADRDRIVQVVINLVSNAIKFTPSGEIKCGARLKDGEIVVSVTDSGVGIKAEDQPKVFEKFKQVGDTLTDKPQGTGLGLPICREIVEHHGGKIWVESEPGKGSTFSFSLPLKPPDRATGGAGTALPIETLIQRLRENVASQDVKPRSILVVDDDANIRSVLQQEFVEAGYQVRLAENGRQALAMVRAQTPGLIVLDVMMPEMNGFEVAAVLKSDPATMDIPIIILSIVEDKERGFRLGVDRYLTKPIDTAALFREVGTLLEQGKSKKKVMVVDEDSPTVRSLTEVLEARGYHVVESNGAELVSKAVAQKPDIIVLSSLLSATEGVRSLRFEKDLENVLFLIYQQGDK